MINRLVAQNTFKIALKGNSFFSTNKKLLAYQTQSSVRIKTLNRETKDIEIPITSVPKQFSLSQTQPWLYILGSNQLLEVYLVEYINGINQGSFKKVAILHNVEEYSQNRWGLGIVTSNRTFKCIGIQEIQEKTEENLNIDGNSLKALTEVDQPYKILSQLNSDRFLLVKQASEEGKQATTQLFDRPHKDGKHEKQATVTYLKDVLALYKSRYVFQKKGQKEVQIIDIDESINTGKFSVEGSIRYADIRQNLLLIVTNKDNTDYFNFLVLNKQPSSKQPLITNRVTYEKGKGDFYRWFNMETAETVQFLDKKKNTDISDSQIQQISETTSSILYIFNKNKEKVEVIKLDHSKLLKSVFGEEKMNNIIYSKKSGHLEVSESKADIQIERARVHSSMRVKAGQKSMQEMQKKFVENLIDIKLKKVMAKFDELQKRVEKLEKVIHGINNKIESNLEKINRREIKDKVEKLFDTLTPQFEKYFVQIFKQVSGVFEQGVSYYNLKLAKQAQFHKDALTQIVTETFKFTDEVVDISKKEQAVSERTEDAMKKILESKKRWNKEVEQFQRLAREGPGQLLKPNQAGSEGGKGQGTEKVFVRADLNFPQQKREP